MSKPPIRIIKIDAKNFRAFPTRPLVIDLSKTGKNLLVYGENGSGKSSLYFALKDFLECAEREVTKRDITVFPYRNFSARGNNGYVRLDVAGLPVPASKSKTKKDTTTNRVYEWSRKKNDTGDQLILEVNKTKGFIDYKALLETYFLQQDSDIVNVFDLLIKNVLKNIENDISRKTFWEEWLDLNRMRERLNARSSTQVEGLELAVKDFNDGLRVKLAELRILAKELLDRFDYQLDLDFNFGGIAFTSKSESFDRQIVELSVTVFSTARSSHHLFLNEAKLSAIAISIFFAALLLQPSSRLKILALDDVLIGLDMSNRLPVLDILNDRFADYQIFFFTYDKAWYEIVRSRVDGKKWKDVEFFAGNTDGKDLPIYSGDDDYFKIAQEYLKSRDYKAAMVYLRTFMEREFKRYCNKYAVPVRYHNNAKDFSAENFWEALKKHQYKGKPLLDATTISDFETYRRVALNPLCHASFAATHLKEVTDAMKAVKKVTDILAKAVKA